ncbi:DMT family transporter [Stieleria varia]|nr:DMT family transporter [Stieleria varia]
MSMSDDHLDAPKRKNLLSILLGFTVGFLLAAAAIVLIRGMDSETDGMNALIAALSIFVPAFLLTMVVWFVQRKGERRPLHWPLALLCGAVGLGGASMLWFTVPTQEQVRQEYLAKHSDILKRRANQFAKIKTAVESVPPGSLLETITDEQREELKTLQLDFRNTKPPRQETWNTLLTCEAEYARVAADTDPDSVMNSWDRPSRKFPRKDRYQYTSDSEVDQIADYAFGDPYFGIWELEDTVKDAKKMKYVVYVRMTDQELPVLTGQEFRGGFRSAEAFVYDLDAEKIASAFTFSATNSEQVDYQYQENAGVAGKTNSAMNSVIEDLNNNMWPAFWNRIHQVAPESKSEFENLELPYKPLSLAEAFLNWKRKSDADKEKAKKIQAELEAQGVSPNL